MPRLLTVRRPFAQKSVAMSRFKRLFAGDLSEAAPSLIPTYAKKALSDCITLEAPLHSCCTAEALLQVVLSSEACAA